MIHKIFTFQAMALLIISYEPLQGHDKIGITLETFPDIPLLHELSEQPGPGIGQSGG